MTSLPISIAYFISPHGFGHAARAVAIMNAIYERLPAARFHIFTLTPEWFFKESLLAPYKLYVVKTDIGLVQRTPFEEDFAQTLGELDMFLPFDRELIQHLAKLINSANCRMVLCDISPLGIAVAHTARIPSVLVENFTWDWIYEPFSEDYPRFRSHIKYLREIFSSADYHIQTEPVCAPQKNACLTTFPVSRKPKTTASKIRQQLGIPDHHYMVLVTMGGIPERFDGLRDLPYLNNISLVIPGGSDQIERIDHMVLLPHHSSFYHPDLVFASDAVVGKAGYSTTAEIFFAGIPFGFIERPNFRESPVMTAFIQRQMSGIRIPASHFQEGRWVQSLPQLISIPRIQRLSQNGADQIAGFIDNLLNS